MSAKQAINDKLQGSVAAKLNSLINVKANAFTRVTLCQREY